MSRREVIVSVRRDCTVIVTNEGPCDQEILRGTCITGYQLI